MSGKAVTICFSAGKCLFNLNSTSPAILNAAFKNISKNSTKEQKNEIIESKREKKKKN